MKGGEYFQCTTSIWLHTRLLISPEINLRRQLKVKKILAYSSMFFMVMMAVISVSAAGTDFSGTWKLDAAKSTMPAGRGGGGTPDITLIVKQDAKTLTVERKVVREGQAVPSTPISYNFDGSETKSELTGRMTGTATHKTKWQSDGKILEINSVTKGNFQGNEFTATAVSHWELADGGKTLKIHTKRESPQGVTESSEVYVKQ